MLPGGLGCFLSWYASVYGSIVRVLGVIVFATVVTSGSFVPPVDMIGVRCQKVVLPVLTCRLCASRQPPSSDFELDCSHALFSRFAWYSSSA